MSALRELEIRQEARFVLWALRSAMAGARGDEAAGTELARGFTLVGVSGTAGTFTDFTRALFAVDWDISVWHGPRCCCVSTEEVFVLNALAEAAERQRRATAGPAQWWRLVLPPDRIAAVDAAARTWLQELERAGVRFPPPDMLDACLRPVQNIAEPARAAGLH